MTNLHLHRWSPELRRAVLRTCPDFFGWPAERQSRYRMHLPEKDRQSIGRLLLEHLLGDAAGGPSNPLDEDRLPIPLQNRLNEALQPLVGVGDDAFSFNEIFDEGLTILDFPTLGAWDQHEHALQQKLRAEHDGRYEAQPYFGNLHGHWARVLVDGRLVYLTLSMAAAAQYGRLQEASADEIQRRVPHRYVRGRHDGEIEREMFRWDSRLDAGGQEALLEELQHRVWTHEQERWQKLAADWAKCGLAGSYWIDNPYPETPPDEQHLEILFTDPKALDRIRFESFLADIRRIERPVEELHRAFAVENARLEEYVAEQLEDLRRNFNPKVARLRKRRKILMHPDAFDALAGDTEEPD